jgi:hypothetical protein
MAPPGRPIIERLAATTACGHEDHRSRPAAPTVAQRFALVVRTTALGWLTGLSADPEGAA